MTHASMTRARSIRADAALAVCALAMAGGGCLERSITITSQPPGARVWLNEVEIGRTPVTTRFKFHGDYDIRLVKQGFEPVHAVRAAEAPLHETPGIDLIASAMPWTYSSDFVWDFVLEPALEQTQPPAELEAGLLERADALKARLDAEP